MALPPGDGREYIQELPSMAYFMGGKRRVSLSGGSCEARDDRQLPQMPRGIEILCHEPQYEQPAWHQTPVFDLPQRDQPMEPPRSCGMERTASGHSIASDTSYHSLHSNYFPDDDTTCSDAQAAAFVREHMAYLRHRSIHSTHGRILRSLIHPKSSSSSFDIDDAALESLFSAANEIFFGGRLRGRVNWDWSAAGSTQHDAAAGIIGTTALRRGHGGFETLIVLSAPILRDTRYDRRLLISTFLHELIHSYLFICCGFKARKCGGHTEGFREIAVLIDAWVGYGVLHLSEMEADLGRFRAPGALPCQGQGQQQCHGWARDAEDYLPPADDGIFWIGRYEGRRPAHEYHDHDHDHDHDPIGGFLHPPVDARHAFAGGGSPYVFETRNTFADADIGLRPGNQFGLPPARWEDREMFIMSR